MATVLRNGTIIVGNGLVHEGGTIIVEGGSIAYAGPAPRGSVSGKDAVLDLKGKTVLPGLIDCHVHLCLDGSPDPMSRLLTESVPVVALKMARNARLTLEGGMTTIRDLGGRDYVDLAIRDGIRSGLIPGPRMLCSGKAICMTGGHGWQFGREADGVDGVRAAVREQLKAGVDLVKLMATGGILTEGVEPGSTQYTLEELMVGVEEAKKAGRRTATHAQGTEGIKNAIWAGIDSIEHGIFLDDEAVDLMKERNVFFVPTLNAPYQIVKAGTKKGVPTFAVEKSKAVVRAHLESVKKARQAGVSIAMGTDAGTPFNLHGDNAVELELLTRGGMTSMEAIMAGTKIAAEVLGLGKWLGTLEAGKWADLIVVEGDPLDDITLLQRKERILAVMKEGWFFKFCL